MTSRKKIEISYAWEQLQGRQTVGGAKIDLIILEVGKLPEGKIKSKRWDDERSQNVTLTVERRDELEYRLDGALALLAHHDILNSGESVSGTDKRLRAIRAAADELNSKLAKVNALDSLDSLAYLENAIRKFYQTSAENKAALNVFGQLQPVGNDILAGSVLAKFVHATGVLGAVAELAIKANAKRKAKGRGVKNAPHKADAALDQCIEILGNIYCQIWEKPRAGFSRYADTRRADSHEPASWEAYANKGEAYGPFIRFAQCSLKVAGIDLEGDAIARIILKQRRAKKKKVKKLN